jgi:hypothetical protein
MLTLSRHIIKFAISDRTGTAFPKYSYYYVTLWVQNVHLKTEQEIYHMDENILTLHSRILASINTGISVKGQQSPYMGPNKRK